MEKYWQKLILLCNDHQTKKINRKDLQSKNEKHKPGVGVKIFHSSELFACSTESSNRKLGLTEEHRIVLKTLMKSKDIPKTVKTAIMEAVYQMDGLDNSNDRRMGVKETEYSTLLKQTDKNTSRVLRVAIESGVYALEGRKRSQKRRKALVW